MMLLFLFHSFSPEESDLAKKALMANLTLLKASETHRTTKSQHTLLN